MSIVSRELTMIFIHLGIILISYNIVVNSQLGFPPDYSPNQYHTPPRPNQPIPAIYPPQPTPGPPGPGQIYRYTSWPQPPIYPRYSTQRPVYRYCYTDQECWKLGPNAVCQIQPGHSQG